MKRCHHCRQPIHGEHLRMDAGTRLGTEIAFDRLPRDVDLHHPCYGPWMAEHYPWLVTVKYRDRTRAD